MSNFVSSEGGHPTTLDDSVFLRGLDVDLRQAFDEEFIRAVEEMTLAPIRAAIINREAFRWPVAHLAHAYVVEARNVALAERAVRDAELAARPPRPRAARRTRRRHR